MLFLLACAAPATPNVLWILTDDQRADTLWSMPHVEEDLVQHGVLFSDAQVTTPLCCPSRASMLSGGFFAKHTGVLTNELPNGGYTRFLGGVSLPKRAQQVGYHTAFFGRYLNGYGGSDAVTIPEGWDEFRAIHWEARWQPSSFFSGRAGRDAEIVDSESHVTDAIHAAAAAWLQDARPPWFAIVAHKAPHLPVTPVAEDAHRYDDLTWTPPSDAPLSDKPAWVLDAQEPLEQSEVRAQLASLAAVDRSVAGLVDVLEATGQLENTAVFFFSDNGYQWGEHGLIGKGKPYQASLQVPLVVRAPGVVPSVSTALVAADLDVAATTQALMGLPVRSDGQSLLPLLRGEDGGWEALPVGFYTPTIPMWSGVVTPEWKYVHYATGEEELYDRVADPDELDGGLDPGAPLALLSALDVAHRGLTVLDTAYAVPVGERWEMPIATWGGVAPLSYALEEPIAGIAIEGDRLVGTLEGTEAVRVHVVVQDRGASPYTALPQRYVAVIEVYPDAAEPAPRRVRSDLQGAPTREGDLVVVQRAHALSTWIEVSDNLDFDGIPWRSEPQTGTTLRFAEVPSGWLRVAGQPGRWWRPRAGDVQE